MALKKMRGFNRGKSYLDAQAIAGATNKLQGVSMAMAKGARWDQINGGTAQRVVVTGNGATAYPAHTGNVTSNYWVEDFGSLADFYTAGGYCATMYARCNNIPWRSLFVTPSGIVRTITAAMQYQDAITPGDFYSYGPRVNLPLVPVAERPAGTVASVVGYISGPGWLTVTDDGELLMASSLEYCARWKSVENPVDFLQIGSSSVPTTPVFIVNHVLKQDGFYYFFGNSNAGANANGMIYRNATFALTGGAFVYNNVTNSARSKGAWFAQYNCFISVGGSGYGSGSFAGAGNILRSTDGITWTLVYTHATTNTYFLDVMADPNSGRLIAVGGGGCLATSDDGGTTWTARTSGVPTNTHHITALTVTPDNLICGITNMGNSIISSDGGLSWSHVETEYVGALGTDVYSFWRPFNLNGKLYAWRVYAGARSYVVEYYGAGKFRPIVAQQPQTFPNTLMNVPVGAFWADAYSGTGNLTGGRNMLGVSMTSQGMAVQGSANTGIWGALVQVTSEVDNNWHKLQLVGTAIPGQALPTFTISAYIDNVLVAGPYGPYTATNANQRLWLTTSQSGFNMFSDFVVNDFSGTRNNLPPAEDLQIRPRLQASDAAAPQWTRVPETVANNALAAQGDGSVISAPSSVQSDTVNQTDAYTGATWTTPSAYKIAAVGVTAVAQRLGIPTPTVELSMVEDGTSLPVASVTANGSTTAYVPATVLYETRIDQSGWTDATLNNSTIQLKRST